jgi:hypothetical protein
VFLGTKMVFWGGFTYKMGVFGYKNGCFWGDFTYKMGVFGYKNGVFGGFYI